MFGKKTADKVLKYIEGLSDEERSKLMQQLGIEEEPAASEDTGETPEEAAVERADQDAPEAEEGTPAEDPMEEPEANAVEDPTEEPASEEAPEEVPEGSLNDAPAENGAEAVAALAMRMNEMQGSFETRIKELEDFVDAMKGKNQEQLDTLGFQRAEQARKAGAESYMELRKRTIGV